MDEQSIFFGALERETPQERAAWLNEACGGDEPQKQRILQLLQKHEQASSFLEKPAPGLHETVIPAADANRAASLDAGLASAFLANDAVVIGDANHSVLKMLANTLNKVPAVSLRESEVQGADPITRPSSPEMPACDSGSRYRLDGEIARGGMGAIIKGRDTDLGRDLAIKVLLDSHKDKPEVIQRFIEEAQIGGQLQHPGIVPIYELGQFADKRPFFAMKLVKGETLSKLLSDREDAANERGRLIGIFEQICQTMAYAHSRGVIHRDLKPANIMVGAFGEVQVVDWGLAKVLQVGGVADEKKSQTLQHGQSIIQTMRSGVGSDSPGTVGSVGSHTQMGSVMGTPAYMPPEQALGEIDQMDERADVFGLGGNATQLKLNNANLHAVFSPDGKMLMTSGFNHEIGIWRLPTTGPPSFRVSQFDTENATGSFSSDGRYLAVGGNKNCTVWRFPEANTVLGRVEEWKTLRRPRASMDGKLATLGVWHEGFNPPRGSGELQVVQMEDGQPAGPAITCPGSIIDSCIGSDNRSVAAAFFASGKGHLAVYDVGTGREAFPSITLPDLPISLAARPGHAELAVLCNNGDLLVVDANQGTAIRKLPHDTWGTKRFWATTRVAYSPDGSTLVTLSPSDQLFVRDASTGELRYPPVTAASRGGFCRAIAFSRDSRFLATAINEVDFVQVWDLDTGQPVGGEMPHPNASYGTFSVEFSPDGKSILTAHSDGRLRWWDWRTGQLKVPPMQDSKELYDCRFTPDGRFGLTTLRHGGIGVWDLKTGKPAAPEIRYPADMEIGGTVVFGLSGVQGIVGCLRGYPIVDLSSIFVKPESSLTQIQTQAELASNRILQLGELTRVLNWKETSLRTRPPEGFRPELLYGESAFIFADFSKVFVVISTAQPDCGPKHRKSSVKQ